MISPQKRKRPSPCFSQWRPLRNLFNLAIAGVQESVVGTWSIEVKPFSPSPQPSPVKGEGVLQRSPVEWSGEDPCAPCQIDIRSFSAHLFIEIASCLHGLQVRRDGNCHPPALAVSGVRLFRQVHPSSAVLNNRRFGLFSSISMMERLFAKDSYTTTASIACPADDPGLAYSTLPPVPGIFDHVHRGASVFLLFRNTHGTREKTAPNSSCLSRGHG